MKATTDRIGLNGPLISHREYVSALKSRLPPEAFRLNHWKFVELIGHVGLILILVYWAGRVDLIWLRLLFAVIIGHSVACLSFIGHDVSHGSVVKKRGVRYWTEVLLFVPFLMPPTVWRRMHNQIHHAHMNTPEDSDRLFLESEKGLGTEAYNRGFSPCSNPVRWNPIVLLQFAFFSTRYTLTALVYGWFRRSAVEPTLPYYGPKRLLRVMLEVVLIVAAQYGLFRLGGGSWAVWLLCCLLPVAIASMFLMMYILTNHRLNPVTEEVDPVQGSLSIGVPRVLDMIHSNFSYHTEHHLFPAMNSRYYPLVSELLTELFPAQYNRIPLAEAWERLWDTPAYATVTVTDEDENG